MDLGGPRRLAKGKLEPNTSRTPATTLTPRSAIATGGRYNEGLIGAPKTRPG
jgi:hypothetical protein